tara:strand:- start:361 stop:618 length:258 start_codon:yes stop_codon:yes gene_type:complete
MEGNLDTTMITLDNGEVKFGSLKEEMYIYGIKHSLKADPNFSPSGLASVSWLRDVVERGFRLEDYDFYTQSHCSRRILASGGGVV